VKADILAGSMANPNDLFIAEREKPALSANEKLSMKAIPNVCVAVWPIM